MDTVYIGADHAGFKLKEQLKKYLSKQYRVVDKGNKRFNPKDDYPDYAARLGRAVAKTGNPGILVCGSAEGICIAANKVRGVRAVAPWTMFSARKSREHNDANVLCLSGWSLSLHKAKALVDAWLETPFSGELRHLRRIEKIAKLERR
ncbi:RpiB/LacA/LacB family sugar-phosphate isomerase [Candidatus Woesearchaeota archaeon]|nr:RpiB/LacA/LacB family sugar-phosphate isomerase [Candidatus Woesearchaeota archaeon]